MLDSISNVSDVVEEIISTSNSPMQEINTNFGCELWICLLFTLLLNIFCIGIQHFFNYKLKGVDLKNSRKSKILDLGLNVEVDLYKRLNKLSDFDYLVNEKLLAEISSLKKFLDENKIFLTDKQFTAADNILDYFLGLCANPRCKDYTKEKDLLKKYIEIFNG